MRLIKIAMAVATLLVVCGYLFCCIEPALWKAATRRASIWALKAAQTEQQLNAAVKPWGVFVTGKDGSWVAIRYRDTHAGRILSLAIAKDSGGQWYECHRHFCGSLLAYQRSRVQYADNPNLLGKMFPVRTNRLSSASSSQLEALFSASGLQGLRRALGQMDFEQISLE